MCGIVGVISLSGRPVEPAILGQMTNLLAHRGPDGAGFMLAVPETSGYRHTLVRTIEEWSAPLNVRVVFGHRRLAILDLSEHGLQPMSDPTGQVWIVLNGEIYNFRELRSELTAAGFMFET